MTLTMIPNLIQEYGEAVAAISARVHTSPDYQKLYDQCAEILGGAEGISAECAKAGHTFACVENREDIVKRNTEYEWVDAIDIFSGYLIADMIKQGISIFEDRAVQAIKEAKERSAVEHDGDNTYSG